MATGYEPPSASEEVVTAEDVDVHRRSAIRHRQAAAVDRRVAEQRRKEFEAELSPGTDG
jgi:hypothetical protein